MITLDFIKFIRAETSDGQTTGVTGGQMFDGQISHGQTAAVNCRGPNVFDTTEEEFSDSYVNCSSFGKFKSHISVELEAET